MYDTSWCTRRTLPNRCFVLCLKNNPHSVRVTYPSILPIQDTYQYALFPQQIDRKQKPLACMRKGMDMNFKSNLWVILCAHLFHNIFIFWYQSDYNINRHKGIITIYNNYFPFFIIYIMEGFTELQRLFQHLKPLKTLGDKEKIIIFSMPTLHSHYLSPYQCSDSAEVRH